MIGLGRSRQQLVVAASLLLQISRHDGGIKVSLAHLVGVDQYLGFALCKAQSEVKLHRGIIVGIEGQDAAVYPAGLSKLAGFADQPGEDGQHRGVAAQDIGLRVPLHAEYALMLRALHGLHHTVRAPRRDAQSVACLAYGLMM